MEKSDLNYKRKPAFMSFLITYFFWFGIGLLLMTYSSAISREVTNQLTMELDIQHSNLLWKIPYGIIFSLPFLIYGVRTLLWNVMSSYEINSSGLRLLTGSLIRKEHFFRISDFVDISFKQNLIEAPLRIGKIVLKAKSGGKLVLRGVHNVESVVESLRSTIDSSDLGRAHRPPFS